MMICQNASKCNKENCEHKVLHNRKAQCSLPCLITGGIKQSMCAPYRKVEIDMKTKGEPVIQKLEELEDQKFKADAGKLRYDLIPGELINETLWNELFQGVYPGTLTIQVLDEVLSDCVKILGNWDNFLRELAKVYTFGCQKYSEKSWQTVPNGRARYEAGMFRHIDAFKRGEYVNWEDGGVLHVAQVAFNAIAVKWFILQEK